MSDTRWPEVFEGSGRDWHESLPDVYTYGVKDLNALVCATHEYEACLASAKNQLAEINALHEELQKQISELLALLTPAPVPQSLRA